MFGYVAAGILEDLFRTRTGEGDVVTAQFVAEIGDEVFVAAGDHQNCGDDEERAWWHRFSWGTEMRFLCVVLGSMGWCMSTCLLARSNGVLA